jgi:hypothetical protein
MAYQRNDESATKTIGGSYSLKEHGEYIGYITQAWENQTEKTEGAKIEFTTIDGIKIVSNLMYYSKRTKKTLFEGDKLFSQILGVLDIKIANTINGKITSQQWNSDTNQFEEVTNTEKVYKDIQGNKIGCVFKFDRAYKKDEKTGEYTVPVFNKKGDPVFNTIPVLYFDADTRLTYGEMVKGADEPKEVKRVVASLKYPVDHPLLNNINKPKVVDYNKQKDNEKGASKNDNFDDSFDDDIPF